jgi:hypothetical protein
MGAAKMPGDHVRDAISAQLGVRIGAFQQFVAAAEVFHHARGDQQIYGRYKGQSESGGNHVEDIGRRPGEAGESGNGKRQATYFALMKVKGGGDQDRSEDPDERGRCFGCEARHTQRHDDHDAADDQSAGLRFTDA